MELIDNLVKEFCQHLQIKQEELIPSPSRIKFFHSGRYTVANPGLKTKDSIIGKLWRKRQKNKLPDSFFTEHPQENFNLIKDINRCSALVNNFAEGLEVAAALQQKFGGNITYKNKPLYKDIKVQFLFDGINCEVQIHTYDSFVLKMATDSIYQEHRDQEAKDPESLLSDPRFIQQANFIKPICDQIYAKSGFEQVLPDIVKQQSLNTELPAMQYNDINVLYQDATLNQDNLVTTVSQTLATMFPTRGRQRENVDTRQMI